MAAFSHTLRVRYAECDGQGIVFNAHFLAYFDISMTELWRAAFGSYGEMVGRGVDMVVAEAGLRFRAPAHFDDELVLEVEMDELGTSSLPSRHRIWRGGTLIVEGTMRHVMVDAGTFTKTAIPDWVREQLAPWTAEAAIP